MPPTRPYAAPARALAAFLRAHGLRPVDLAARVDPPVARHTAARWARGAARPGPRYRAQLARLTAGVVPAAAWRTAGEARRAAWTAAHPPTPCQVPLPLGGPP